MSYGLDVLRGAATVAGKGFEGYAQDEKTSAAQLIAQQKAKLDANNAAVLNALRGAQQKKLEAPAPTPLTTVEGPDGTPVRGPDVAGAHVYVPPRPTPLTTVAGADGKPVRAPDVAGAHVYEPPPPKPNLSFQTVTPGEGQPPTIIGVDP